MRTWLKLLGISCLTLGFASALGGCNSKAGSGVAGSESGHHEHAHEHAHHDHAEAGPHGGRLIELGDEEYHVEMVHDEATHTVAVYLLDSSGKKSVSIPSQDAAVMVNLLVRQTPAQYRLSPVAGSSDQPGHASEFSTTDDGLCDALCGEHDSQARLSVTINGKPFVGTIGQHVSHQHAHAHEPGRAAAAHTPARG